MRSEPFRDVTRRRFLQAGGAGVIAGWALARGLTEAAAAAPPGAASLEVPLNSGWLFGGPSVPGSTQPQFDDRGFTTVTLPHCVTPLTWREWDPASWEQLWIYRRHFDLPPELAGMRTFVDFTGAMTAATPTVNGQALSRHLGGYLPFSYELTDHVGPTGNLLAVEIDARWLQVPPDGSPNGPSAVDYLEPGGLYRDVWLRAVPQIFIADLFARPAGVLDPSPQVQVQCTVDAAGPASGARLEVALMDGTQTLGKASAAVTVAAAGQVTVPLQLTGFGGVQLWSPDHPRLYDVVATLYVGERPVHDFRRRIGFRQAVFQADGFFLNGSRFKLFGLNRHQIYPYTGMSMPARVQRRDAAILRRQLNCTMVRCSHYPQSSHFLDACDELGLMVWEETPGWGYLPDDPAWQQQVVQNVHDMIVRDRNRPSVIVWGVQVNESAKNPTLYTATRALAYQLDGSRQTSGSNTSHSTADWVQDVFAYDDYHSAAGNATLLPPIPGVPYLVTEAVGTLDGPKLFRRIDSQDVQQAQARLHAQVHDIARSDDAYSGLLGWCAFDYDSLSGNIFQDLKWPGVADTFRTLKPGAAFYQAQVSPQVRPVIEPAFSWDFGPTSPVTTLGATATIWSNCERLEIYLDGSHHGTLAPDTGGYPHLLAPPFHLDVSGIDGSARPELRIDGYVGGRLVLSRSFSSDPSGDRLEVVADDTALVADGSDATRVGFRAVDRHGAPRPYAGGDVTISVDGPATYVGEVVTFRVVADPALLSPGQQSTVTATLTNGAFALGDNGGAGAIWIRSLPGAPGTVVVRVSHPTLGSGEVRIETTAPPAGPSLGTAPGARSAPMDLTQVTIALTVPAGWTSVALSPTTAPSLAPGASMRSTWRITAPGSGGGSGAGITAGAGFLIAGQPARAGATAPVALPIALAQAFDNPGISDDAGVTAANFDGVGNSYSAQALAAAGLTRGATITHGGIAFTWPDAAPGQPDNVVAEGQTILVSGSGSRLGFLGAGSPAAEGGSGTVFYTDGSTSGYTVSLDNWFFAPGPENEAIATLPYCNDSNPATNQGVAGQRNQTVYVFFAAIPITPGKTVKSVTLPSGGSIPPTGRVTGMHVFALAVG